MLTEHLGKSYRYTAKTIGIKWDIDKQQNPFRPKRLRHYFTSCAKKAGIDEYFVKILMGHVLTEGENYIQDRAELEIVYCKMEPCLSIFTASDQLEKKTQELAEVSDKIKELKDTIFELRLQKLEVKDLIERQNGKIKYLEQMVTTIMGYLGDVKDEDGNSVFQKVVESLPFTPKYGDEDQKQSGG